MVRSTFRAEASCNFIRVGRDRSMDPANFTQRALIISRNPHYKREEILFSVEKNSRRP